MIALMIQPALDFVISALEEIRETSDHAPRASRNALTQLQSVYSAAISVTAAPESLEHLREAQVSATGRQQPQSI
jgi:hypothetical protein